MANTYISRAATGSVTSDKTFTFSHWIKRAGGLGSTQYFFMHENASSHAQKLGFDFTTANKIRMSWWDGSNEYNLDTKRLFRDTSGWYNFVFRFDSTQSTASDRVRFYVNGQLEEITNANGSSPTYPGQNATMNLGQKIMAHGRYQASSPGSYFDGSLSHIHYCDGQSYAPTVFGETDSTTGEWKIKTNVTATYGNNGYFILKDGNSVTNQAGNSSGNFSVGAGTLTKTEDNPSNVFATLSPNILPRNSGETISNGNLFFGTSAAIWNTESSAFGIASGKYYFEVKLKDNGTDRRFRWGLQKNAEITKTGENKVLGGADNNAIGYATGGESATQGIYFINQTSTTMSDGDINENNAIYGFAIDLDNQRMYGHFNGAWFHSGNPSAGSGGIDVSSFYTVGEPLFPSFTVHNSNIEINFGNGYFGTTAVSSAGTNASGNGIFEYDVPTGYTALSTKGLNL